MKECPICQAVLVIMMYVLGRVSNYDVLKTYLASVHEMKHSEWDRKFVK